MSLFKEDIKLKHPKITEQYSFDEIVGMYGQNEVFPLFIISENKLQPVTGEEKLKVESGQSLVSLLSEEQK